MQILLNFWLKTTGETVNLSLIFTEIIAISLHLQYDMPRANILTDFAGLLLRETCGRRHIC